MKMFCILMSKSKSMLLSQGGLTSDKCVELLFNKYFMLV